MVKIRLNRFGCKGAPRYRVLVADSRTPRGGQFIDEVGYYDPTQDPCVLNLDLEKINAWIKKGAQPTDTVRELIKVASK